MKKPTAEELNAAAWRAALSEPAAQPDEVPNGWLNVLQLCEMMGKERGTISTRMARMVREGKAEMQKFRILTGRGVYPVPHYRLK